MDMPGEVVFRVGPGQVTDELALCLTYRSTGQALHHDAHVLQSKAADICVKWLMSSHFDLGMLAAVVELPKIMKDSLQSVHRRYLQASPREAHCLGACMHVKEEAASLLCWQLWQKLS